MFFSESWKSSTVAKDVHEYFNTLVANNEKTHDWQSTGRHPSQVDCFGRIALQCIP